MHMCKAYRAEFSPEPSQISDPLQMTRKTTLRSDRLKKAPTVCYKEHGLTDRTIISQPGLKCARKSSKYQPTGRLADTRRNVGCDRSQ